MRFSKKFKHKVRGCQIILIVLSVLGGAIAEGGLLLWFTAKNDFLASVLIFLGGLLATYGVVMLEQFRVNIKRAKRKKVW